MKKTFLKALIIWLTIILLASATYGLPPQIRAVFLSEEKINANDAIKITVKATDDHNQQLNYAFSGPGRFDTTLEPNVSFWTPSSQAGLYTITIRVWTSTDQTLVTRDVLVMNTAEPIIPMLHAEGTRILDEDNKEVLLNGVCLANNVYRDTPELPTYHRKTFEPDETDYARVSSWGANAVRLYLNAKWFSSPRIWDYLHHNIRLAKKYHIYLILNLHFAPGESVRNKQALWGNPKQKNALIKIWTDIATTYKNSSVIAGYDLLNEPAPPDDREWWALASSLAKAIRACEDNHLLFVENTYTKSTYNGFPQEKIAANNIVYSFHFYTPTAFTHQGTSWTGLPDGVSYPFTQQFYEKYCGGEYGFPGVNASTQGRWEMLDPGPGFWVKPSKDANSLFVELCSEGNPGEVMFRHIQLYKKDKTGTVSEIPLDNPDFALLTASDSPLGWDPKCSAWNSAILEVDTLPNQVSGNHALKISESSELDKPGSGYAIWQHRRGILIEPDCRYQLKGAILASLKTRGRNTLQLHFARTRTTVVENNTLQSELEQYVRWADDHEVPLYCGEYGVVGAAPSDDRKAWLTGVLRFLDGNNSLDLRISRTYHVYRDYLGITEVSNRHDFGLLSAPEGAPPSEGSLDTSARDLIFQHRD